MDDDELLAGRGDRFAAAVAAIDVANRDDPETIVVGGQTLPKELTHARMMCEHVLRLDPDATELQLLAARAHHIRRWELPRGDYPEGRSGYLRWRAEQKRRHAALVEALLADVGYGDEEIARVVSIVRKQGLGRDEAVQTHEDALCLVFLETQFDDLIERLGHEIVDVVTKTVAKMSVAGVAAVGELDLSPTAREVIEQAVS